MTEDEKRYVVATKTEPESDFLCHVRDGQIVPIVFDSIPAAEPVAEALSKAGGYEWQVQQYKPAGLAPGE